MALRFSRSLEIISDLLEGSLYLHHHPERIFGLAAGIDGQVDIAAGVDLVITKPDRLEKRRQQIFEMFFALFGFFRLLYSAEQFLQRFFKGVKLLSAQPAPSKKLC
jgi:hypothetical protein